MPTPVPETCNFPRTVSDRRNPALPLSPPMLPPVASSPLPRQTSPQAPSPLSPTMPGICAVERHVVPGPSTPPVSTSPSMVTINIVTSPNVMLSVASSSHDAPTGSLSSHCELHVPSGVHVPAAMPQPTASLAPRRTAVAHVVHGTAAPMATPSSSLVPQNSPLTPQALKWAALASKHGDERLRRHAQWDFHGEWLPYYEYQPVCQITDIWTEWAEGIGNYLPVQLLCEEWGAKWRRNVPKLKTEANRRMSVVQLVEALQKKRNWHLNIALHFLHEKYEPHYTPHQFCDFLKHDHRAGAESVLAAAAYYP
ncbi:hypothetical protein SCP_0510430 [Sparassis crispa]|uniref:Transcription activator GCR1-like domain-containing protein n=1 Tax=Sparassis crispa TaxID=139825 RepID=A0A401GQF7_9APHY|nr:hypothetical protein SCP_0510430 [Sparassis crispa]GBE83984.1 hypothetical protein SCP_0510430 [Sparassis crispa]